MVSIDGDGDALVTGTLRGENIVTPRNGYDARISAIEEALVSVATDVTCLKAEVFALRAAAQVASAHFTALEQALPNRITEAVKAAQARRML